MPRRRSAQPMLPRKYRRGTRLSGAYRLRFLAGALMQIPPLGLFVYKKRPMRRPISGITKLSAIACFTAAIYFTTYIFFAANSLSYSSVLAAGWLDGQDSFDTDFSFTGVGTTGMTRSATYGCITASKGEARRSNAAHI